MIVTRSPTVEQRHSSTMDPTQAHLTRVHDEVNSALYRLNRLMSEDAYCVSGTESQNLSISLLLGDLESIAESLNRIVFTRAPERERSTEPSSFAKPVAARYQGSNHLAAMKSGSRAATTAFESRPMVSMNQQPQQPSARSTNDPPTTGSSTRVSLRIAPLKMTRKGLRPSATGIATESPPKSPFHREIRALDMYIQESCQLRRTVSASLCEADRRPASLTGIISSPVTTHHRAMAARPKSLDSHQVYGQIFHVRQFSTAEKARRLRTIRGAPSIYRSGEDGSKMGGKTGSEPLRLEELMDFLRDGNSLREL